LTRKYNTKRPHLTGTRYSAEEFDAIKALAKQHGFESVQAMERSIYKLPPIKAGNPNKVRKSLPKPDE
jgi:hypothetical protein